MRTITLTSIVTSLATLFSLSAANLAHADGPDIEGGMVGGSEGFFAADIGSHSGEAALAAGAPRSDVSGLFGLLKVQGGLLLRVTRFGSEAGLEGSFGLGWNSGGAYGGKEEGRLSCDLSFGILLVPMRAEALGGVAFKLAGGVGTDFDVDYLYASARLGFGEVSDTLGVELGYTYRVGDAPTGATLLEHKIAASVLVTDIDLLLGFAVDFGESTRYTGVAPARSEKFQVDTMRKGDYQDLIFTIGYKL